MIRRKGKFRLATCLLITFFSAICFGVINIVLMPKVIMYFMNKEMTLVEGTNAYSAFLDSGSVPVFTKFYLFTVENPDQFTKDRLQLAEMGPYTFREFESKVEVESHPENGTLSYGIKKRWYFKPNHSAGNLSDIITTINFPAIASADMARGNFFMALGISSLLHSADSSIFVRKTADELLMSGYDDELMSLGSMFSDSEIPMDKFGWFYKRNDTSWADGRYNIFTGSGSKIDRIGRIHSWNDRVRTHFDGRCGEIRGSAGGFYPPNVTSDYIEIFSHEVCRTLTFIYKGDTAVHGLKGRVYELDELTFANGTIHPPNECFHNNLPSGLQNNTRCKMKSPAFISFPHFLHADSYYSSRFKSDSFKPDPGKHGSRIVLEPTLGVPLEVKIRIQINIRLNRNEDVDMFSQLPQEDLYFPVLWLETRAKMPPDLAAKLSMIIKLPEMASSIGLGVALFGLLGLVIAVGYQQYRVISSKRIQVNKKMLQLSEEEDEEEKTHETLSLVQ